ncbi:MAG: amino acid ABC transporter substrate-binding protein [Chloroflexi bacterium]|nr:amino acid ABC transporter substrate-binding protein [Chloroflexota bacterium]MYD48260.1 amino acid ABC transporter substrate-binding protein [Chloroflexota bacterium]
MRPTITMSETWMAPLVIAAALGLLLTALACGDDRSPGQLEKAHSREYAQYLVNEAIESYPKDGRAETLAYYNGEAAAAPITSQATAMNNQGVDRLQIVRDRGTLVCASNNSVAGFGFLDAGGNTVGFDVDLCRAVAAAVLGNPDAVEFRTTTAAERGPAIQSGEIDIMSRNTTWTSSRDATWGNFAQTMFYDGQGFMAPRSLGITGMMELRDASVCVQQGTTTELNIQDFDNQNSMNFDILTFPDNISSNEAYQRGQCDALTTDRSGLVSTRAGFETPEDHVILPGTISEEPLGPVVPHGDDLWFALVNIVMAILVHAEAYGVTSDNVPTTATGDTAVDRLMGLEGFYGQEALGLPNTVAQDVIRGVGNYGEIYDRHLSPLGLEREGSRNALWANAPCSECPRGGQIFAPPLR